MKNFIILLSFAAIMAISANVYGKTHPPGSDQATVQTSFSSAESQAILPGEFISFVKVPEIGIPSGIVKSQDLTGRSYFYASGTISGSNVPILKGWNKRLSKPWPSEIHSIASKKAFSHLTPVRGWNKRLSKIS